MWGFWWWAGPAPVVELPFQIGGIPDSRKTSSISISGIWNPTNLEWTDCYKDPSHRHREPHMSHTRFHNRQARGPTSSLMKPTREQVQPEDGAAGGAGARGPVRHRLDLRARGTRERHDGGQHEPEVERAAGH